jgi:hypothetical protein
MTWTELNHRDLLQSVHSLFTPRPASFYFLATFTSGYAAVLRRKMITCCNPTHFFLGVSLDWVHLVRQPLFGLLYQPLMMVDDKRGAVGGMAGTGNRRTRRKPAPVPLCPPQITHNLTWARTRATVAGSREPTTARPTQVFLQTKHSSNEKYWGKMTTGYVIRLRL